MLQSEINKNEMGKSDPNTVRILFLMYVCNIIIKNVSCKKFTFLYYITINIILVLHIVLIKSFYEI